MTLKLLISLSGAVLCGAVLALWQYADPKISVTCRPSDPAIAAMQSEKPVVLFWGNSLVFDHGWPSSQYISVNCAQQGLTVEAATKVAAELPDLQVDAVVLALGSVELASRASLDMAKWHVDLGQVLTMLRTTYRGAAIVLVSVPEGTSLPIGWAYQNPSDVEKVNGVLRSLAQEGHFLNLAATLTQAGVVDQTYDGIHLTIDSYSAWNAALVSYFKRLLS